MYVFMNFNMIYVAITTLGYRPCSYYIYSQKALSYPFMPIPSSPSNGSSHRPALRQ